MQSLAGIDLAVLMDASGNNREIAADLLKLFFELTAQEQANLSAAIAGGRAPEAAAVAHKVAGSCSACGMHGLAARFRELELLCKQVLPDDAGARLQTITAELGTVRRQLETEFNCNLMP